MAYKIQDYALFGVIKELSLLLLVWIMVTLMASWAGSLGTVALSLINLMGVLALAIYGALKWSVIGFALNVKDGSGKAMLQSWLSPCPSIATLFTIDLIFTAILAYIWLTGLNTASLGALVIGNLFAIIIANWLLKKMGKSIVIG